MFIETERADMTRRTIAFLIAAGILLGPAAARLSFSQGPEGRLDTRPVSLYVDLGYINLNSQPRWMAIGPQLELRLGRLISINPEVAIWFRDTFRGGVDVVPGATINFRIKRFFVGGGAVRRVSDWAESASGWLLPKIHVGYLTGPARLALSAMYLNRSDRIVLGMTISMGIGRRPREPED